MIDVCKLHVCVTGCASAFLYGTWAGTVRPCPAGRRVRAGCRSCQIAGKFSSTRPVVRCRFCVTLGSGEESGSFRVEILAISQTKSLLVYFHICIYFNIISYIYMHIYFHAVCISMCVCMYPSIYLIHLHPSICLSIVLSVYLSFCLSICHLFIFMSVYQSIYLSRSFYMYAYKFLHMHIYTQFLVYIKKAVVYAYIACVCMRICI